MSTFDLSKRIKVANPHANISEFYGTYNGTSLNEAKDLACSATANIRQKGLTVGLTVNNGEVQEFWFKNGINDSDLVPKHNYYTLPTANNSTLGGVKVGENMQISDNGEITAKTGTSEGTVCVGNDSRLSDSRQPVAHTHTNSDLVGISEWAKATTKPTYTADEIINLNETTTEIQTQINAKAPTNHASTATTYGIATATKYGHSMASSATPLVAGTATVGTDNGKFARENHVHPAQTSVTGNAGTATKLATARKINGVSFDGSANIAHFGTCSTASGTTAKTVNLVGFSLVKGAIANVKFIASNTATNPTLNVNSTGAKPILYRGEAIKASYLNANSVYSFVYDDTTQSFELIGDINATDSISGILPISSGGTGANTAAMARINLGITPTNIGAATPDDVRNAIAGLVNSSPAALDTLSELANAINNDANFSTTMVNALSGKVDKVNGKGLSTEDYTTADKNKLAGITAGAQPNTVNSVNGKIGNVNVTLSDLDVTATATELNKLDGATATTNELNILHGLTATTNELNILHGLTATNSEINHLSGVTSAIQTQINAKAPTNHASTATTYGIATATKYGHSMASALAPLVAGTANAGTDNGKFARENHVHPAQTSVTGNAGTASTLQTARTIDGVNFDGSANIHHLGYCETEGHISDKILNLNNFTLQFGSRVIVFFKYENTASNLTLNVNNTGAKPLMYRGNTFPTNYIKQYSVHEFIYVPSNNCYRYVGDLTHSTVTTSANGLMLASDKIKLNGIEESANHTEAGNGLINTDGVLSVDFDSKVATKAHTHLYAGSSSVGGVATSANKLETARTVALTGDVVGSASFNGTADIEITATHASEGANVGSFGSSTNVSPTFGGTFTIPYVTINAKGHTTAASSKTITIPSTKATSGAFGIVKVGTGLTSSSGVISVNNASKLSRATGVLVTASATEPSNPQTGDIWIVTE